MANGNFSAVSPNRTVWQSPFFPDLFFTPKLLGNVGNENRFYRLLGNLLGGQGFFQGVDPSSIFSPDVLSGKRGFGMGSLQRLINSGVLKGKRANYFQRILDRMMGNGDGDGTSPDLGGDGFGMDFGGGGSPDYFSDIQGQLSSLIADLLGSPGYDPGLLQNLRTQARETSAQRERNRILRRNEEFAARNLFGSGLSAQDIAGIESEESQNLLGSLNQIDLSNAQAAQRSIDQVLTAINSRISAATSEGQLSLGQARLALEAAIAQFEMNMRIALNSSGIPPEAIEQLMDYLKSGGMTVPNYGTGAGRPIDTSRFVY